MSTLRIALTPGEPAGIGPDLVVKIAQQSLPIELVVIADAILLQERAKQLNLPLEIIPYHSNLPAQPKKSGQISVLNIPLKNPVTCGKLDSANSSYVIETLMRAAQRCLQKEFAAVVTGPVHKGIINDANIKFSGHTEFFAELTHTPRVVMLLTSKELRVALVTTHLPLRAVADAITSSALSETILLLQQGLNDYFGIAHPKILVCGLNPHAGENGHLGREEIDVIIPTLEKLRQENIDLIGPVPADTAFLPTNLCKISAILAMYHDQGLPVLKHLGFDHAVNVTLGLPFIRTSVDHGTALELAGMGNADIGSLQAAINTAIEMAVVKSN